MPTDKQTPRELKVTDKRIFTPDGDIRDEFKQDITPADPHEVAAAAPQVAASAPPRPLDDADTATRGDASRAEEQSARSEPPAGEDRRRTMRDKAENPATPFTNFIEPLIAQGYMSLGLLRNPYQPQAKIDVAAARQMIEILTLLRDKTAGNLSPEENDFLATHLGELKLAFVQRTKSI